jgi:hypothetical protein
MPPRKPTCVIPGVNQLTYRQLAQLGNNMNQIAHQLNQHYGESPELLQILRVYESVGPLVRKLWAEVIGGEPR